MTFELELFHGVNINSLKLSTVYLNAITCNVLTLSVQFIWTDSSTMLRRAAFLLTFYTTVKRTWKFSGKSLVLWAISSVRNCATDSHSFKMYCRFLYWWDLTTGWVGHEVPKVVKSVTQNSVTKSSVAFQEAVLYLESAQVRLLLFFV
jgi:hypothetical protein